MNEHLVSYTGECQLVVVVVCVKSNLPAQHLKSRQPNHVAARITHSILAPVPRARSSVGYQFEVVQYCKENYCNNTIKLQRLCRRLLMGAKQQWITNWTC